MPIELRYFTGGEEETGILSPDKVRAYDAKAISLGYSATDFHSEPSGITESADFSRNTLSFLAKWTTGSSSALNYLNPIVKRELKTTVTESSYTVYRGWKFNDDDDLKELFGDKFPRAGDTVTLELKSPTSWSKEQTSAADFASPRFDTIEKRWYDDDEISEMGYDIGDLLGVGVLVQATLSSSQVMADLEHLSDVTVYDDEAEVICDKTTVTVKILVADKHFFKDLEEPEHDDEEDFDWDEHNREVEHENSMMALDRKMLPKFLKNVGKQETEEDLIDFLGLQDDDATIIAAIMVYGVKFPGMIEYIEKNKTRWPKSYKHFSISSILTAFHVLKRTMT